MNVAKRISVWLCKTFNKTATLILTRKKKIIRVLQANIFLCLKKEKKKPKNIIKTNLKHFELYHR